MEPLIILAVVVILGAIALVLILKGNLFQISMNGKQGKVDVKSQPPKVEDDQPVKVVFKGNKLRGQGTYRMRDAVEFEQNDVDGTQDISLGGSAESSSTDGELK